MTDSSKNNRSVQTGTQVSQCYVGLNSAAHFTLSDITSETQSTLIRYVTGEPRKRYTISTAESKSVLGGPASWPSNLHSEKFSFTGDGSVDFLWGILNRQYSRAQRFFDKALSRLDESNDERNEEIIQQISDVIDLMGEPAICAAYQETQTLGRHHFLLETMLNAIASATEKSTESVRAKVLTEQAGSQSAVTRYAAVRALARMDSDVAKQALEKISSNESNPQIANAAKAYAG